MNSPLTTTETKDRLIAAGLHLFAQRGFDGTSTRLLAAEAGTSLDAIQYHFGSKRGVYIAVVKDIADRIGAKVSHDLEELDVAAISSELAAMQAAWLAGRLVVHLMSEGGGSDGARFILLELINPSHAFEYLDRAFIAQTIHFFTSSAIKAVGNKSNENGVREALAIFSLTLATIPVFSTYSSEQAQCDDAVEKIAKVVSDATLKMLRAQPY